MNVVNSSDGKWQLHYKQRRQKAPMNLQIRMIFVFLFSLFNEAKIYRNICSFSLLLFRLWRLRAGYRYVYFFVCQRSDSFILNFIIIAPLIYSIFFFLLRFRLCIVCPVFKVSACVVAQIFPTSISFSFFLLSFFMCNIANAGI